MTIELVSHPLCPYTHRMRIIAEAKGWTNGQEYRMVELPYATLRAQSREYSPTGELPALMLNGMFASSDPVAIAEFFDSETGLGLLPTDPVARLVVRERERRAGKLLDTMRLMFGGESDEDVRNALEAVFDQLAVIDADFATDGTDATTVRMDVAALAPAFPLLFFFAEVREHDRWSGIPRLKRLGLELTRNLIVIGTLAPSYAEEFEAFFRMTGSAFPRAILRRRKTAEAR